MSAGVRGSGASIAVVRGGLVRERTVIYRGYHVQAATGATACPRLVRGPRSSKQGMGRCPRRWDQKPSNPWCTCYVNLHISAAFWFHIAVCFCWKFWKMAASQHVCRLRNTLYPESSGRVHGANFTCNGCGSADRALRRHLGEKNEVQQFAKEETQDFFRKVKQTKEESNGGRLMWQTIRSTLVNYVTQRQILQFKTDVECTALPLSVYVAQGWDESVVKNCPSVFNETLGVETYKVPVQRDTWTQTFERVEERVLAQEKAASLGKKKKGAPADSGDELDLAAPASAGKQEKNEAKTEKKAAAEQKRICAANLKMSGQAAKALGPLTNALTALDRLETRVGKAEVEVEAGILKTAVDVRGKLELWTKAARDAVNDHEAQKHVPDAEKKSIGSLPFQADSVRTLLQQNTAVQKELKALLPVPVKKTKEEVEAAKKKQGEGQAVEPAPKRRRTKGAA